MHKIIPEKKRITFRNLCELVDESDIGVIYKDYKHMSNYIHVQDICIKISAFTFYEIIYRIFFVMIFYTKESLMLFIGQVNDAYNKLVELDDEMNYLLAFLHDEILGKNPNITKILED